MKLWKWLLIIISIAAVAWFTIYFNRWADDWKSLFFYLDDWKMWVILFIGVTIVGKIIQKLLIAEVRILER